MPELLPGYLLSAAFAVGCLSVGLQTWGLLRSKSHSFSKREVDLLKGILVVLLILLVIAIIVGILDALSSSLSLSFMVTVILAGLFVVSVAEVWRRIFGLTAHTWRTHGKSDNKRWW